MHLCLHSTTDIISLTMCCEMELIRRLIISVAAPEDAVWDATGIYRATEDVTGSQRELLGRLGTAVLLPLQGTRQVGGSGDSEYASASNTARRAAAATAVLGAIMDVEHRALQAKLETLWEVLWASASYTSSRGVLRSRPTSAIPNPSSAITQSLMLLLTLAQIWLFLKMLFYSMLGMHPCCVRQSMLRKLRILSTLRALS